MKKKNHWQNDQNDYSNKQSEIDDLDDFSEGTPKRRPVEFPSSTNATIPTNFNMNK